LQYTFTHFNVIILFFVSILRPTRNVYMILCLKHICHILEAQFLLTVLLCKFFTSLMRAPNPFIFHSFVCTKKSEEYRSFWDIDLQVLPTMIY